MGVAAAERGELLLRPVDRRLKQLRADTVEPVLALVELRAEASEWAAVACRYLALVG